MANTVKVYTAISATCEDQYFTVIAGKDTTTSTVIQQALQQMSVYEDPSFYDLQEYFTTEPTNPGRILGRSEYPLAVYQKWNQRRWRGELRLKIRRQSFNRTELAMQRLMDNLSPNTDDHLTDDMCNLSELSESSMLATLRTRFQHNKIYTYVGTILIAVNPYFFYPIYNPNYRQMYQFGKLGDSPPHIFAIASDAYQSLLSDKEDQAVIISGESGAGKTESTKFLLHHLMNLSAKFEEERALELITLGTGPVLEAFGNAKTLSNNNSSRFGKFIIIRFRENGAYYSASIQQYLLEKSRIVLQAEHERNYHVFYYLLSGAGPQLKQDLHLLGPKDYHYLTHGSVSLKDVNDIQEFQRLQRSLTMLGLTDAIQLSLFRILSAILQLGNIKYHKDESEESCCEIVTPSNLQCVASLLKVDEETLKLALTTRRAKAGGNEFVVPYKLNEAADTRDAMAKALYGAMFDWIVAQVNVALIGKRSRHRHRGKMIGVLDIFGFEVYEENSFEQFCINYANEQLQQYFNKHVFKSEQEEYVREDIRWDAVSFIDNCDCLDLIARKPTGLLHLLDEECSFPGADDNSLFEKFERQHKKHFHYKSPPVKQEDPYFLIVHYAGDVLYRVKGFREKNRDKMHQDIVEVLKTSKNDLVRALIGLPSLAAYRWRKVQLLILATAVFRQGGAQRRGRDRGKSNSLTRIIYDNHQTADHHKASTPRTYDNIERNDRRFSSESAVTTGKSRKSHFHRHKHLGKHCSTNPFARTVSSQFHSSLVSLMETLETAKPYFIRCIKSNNDKAPRSFDDDVVLRQLRYTGMLQTIKIRKSGYSVRIGFDDFFEKYHFLMGPKENDLKGQICRSLESWGFSSSTCDLQVGKNKVFMREEHKQAIQERLQAEVLDRIIIIQKWFRGNLARCRFLAMRRSAIVVQSCIRGWLARVQYAELRQRVSAAVILQACWRGVQARRKFAYTVHVVMLIQKWWRGYKQRKLYRELREKAKVSTAVESKEKESAKLETVAQEGGSVASSEPEDGKRTDTEPPEEKVKIPVENLPHSLQPNSVTTEPTFPERDKCVVRMKGDKEMSKEKSPTRDDLISDPSVTPSVSGTAPPKASSTGNGSTAPSVHHSQQKAKQDASENSPSPLHRRPAMQDKKGVRMRLKVSPSSDGSIGVHTSEKNQTSSGEFNKYSAKVKSDEKMSQSMSALDKPRQNDVQTPLRDAQCEASSPTVKVILSTPETPTDSRKVKRQGSKLRRSRPQKKGNAMSTHFFHIHMFKKGQKCHICCKVFSGFLKQGLKCEACQTCAHHHCVSRVHVCPAHIQEGRRLTFSARKVLSSVSDLDDFDGFLMGKIGSMKSEKGDSIDAVFKIALVQFHTAIVSDLSLKVQAVPDSERASHPDSLEEDGVCATFEQLTLQFSSILKGLAKSRGLHDAHAQVILLQFKNFLDEFLSTRKSRDLKRRYSQVPAIKVNLQPERSSARKKEVYEHKGHSFVLQTFNVLSVCEYCEVQMPVLSQGVVCSACSYTCHVGCFKKIKDKCKTKNQPELKPIDEDEALKIQTLKLKTQFGVPLKKLVPGKVVRVPVVLERLLQHVETNGIHMQGIYRKTPSPSNKAALKASLDRNPLGTRLLDYQVNSSAALVKNFLQSLPQPLMTFELYREFMLATELSDQSQQLGTIHQLISRLPELNHCVLERLLFHLARVALSEDSNLMDPNNLAIIFAPCLFRSKKEPKAHDLVKELTKAQKVLHVIISEQVDRLNDNLENIAKFSSAALTTANELQELMVSKGQDPSAVTDQPKRPLEPVSPNTVRPSSTIEQLTVELQFLERERAEWTAQLPRLKQYKASFPSSEDLTHSISDEDRSGTPSSLTSVESEPSGASLAELNTKYQATKQKSVP